MVEDKQKEWLMYLNRVAVPLDYTMQVCYRVNQPRIPLPQVYKFPIGHRVIFPNELVLETDRDSYEENKDFAEIIFEILKELNIPFVFGFSGNKSFHFHVFMDWRIEIKSEKFEKLKEKGFEFYMARNKIAELLFNLIREQEYDIFGNSKLDYANLYRNSLIREFGGKHEGTSYYKSSLKRIPSFRPQIADYKFVSMPERIELWSCLENLEHAIRYWRPNKKKQYKQAFSHG